MKENIFKNILFEVNFSMSHVLSDNIEGCDLWNILQLYTRGLHFREALLFSIFIYSE